jgi:PAS domain S-box-containing protein
MEPKIYKNALGNMNEKIYIRDLDKNILYINKASERFIGWSSQEALGRKCYEVFGDKGLTCKELCPIEKAISQRAPILYHEGKMKTRSGEERNMQISVSPIYEGESATAAVVAMQDMTRLKELEQTHVKTLMALEKEMEELRDGTAYEIPGLILARIVECLTDEKGDRIICRQLCVKDEIVIPMRIRDRINLTPWQASKQLKELGFFVDRTGGRNKFTPTVDSLRRAAEKIGYQGSLLE